jgi:phosphotriesterase-related protein
MENFEQLVTRRTSSIDNLKLIDLDTSIEELKNYKKYGGCSLVEVTPIGIGRDPLGLKEISEKTGINIVCATGWYVSDTHPKYIKKKNIDELSAILITELTEGLSQSNLKAGIIKCACSYPMQPDEEKVLKAAARAQNVTNAPLTIHPGGLGVSEKQVEPILDIISTEANLKKVYISHMDSLLFGNRGWSLPIEYHKSIMDEYDVTLNFDSFGKNFYYKFPSVFTYDRKKVAAIAELCRQGYDKKLMLSHDICYKMNFKKYGGYGYSHIPKHIVPELRYKGVTQNQIKNMLVENPKKILAY